MQRCPIFITYMLFAFSVVCIYTDLRWGRIYNMVLGPAILVGLGYHLYAGGLQGLWFSIQGLGLGLVLLLLPFMLNGVGAGDVKFLAAAGALGGPEFVWRAFLAGALIGGVLALGFLICRRELLPALKRLGQIFCALLLRIPVGIQKTSERHRMPYGLALGLGVIAAIYLRF